MLPTRLCSKYGLFTIQTAFTKMYSDKQYVWLAEVYIKEVRKCYGLGLNYTDTDCCGCYCHLQRGVVLSLPSYMNMFSYHSTVEQFLHAEILLEINTPNN